MKIVADEGIEGPIVARLRAGGHQVIYIAEVAPGSFDLDILDFANREESLLITFDKDFGDLVFYQYRPIHGIILIRLPDEFSSLEKAEMVISLIQEYGTELLYAFSVIAPNKNRVVTILPQQNRPESK